MSDRPDRATYRESLHLAEISLVSASFTHHEFVPHSHASFAIGLIDAGTARATYLGQACSAEKGDVMLLNPGVVHTGRSASATEVWRYRMLYASVGLIRDAGRSIWSDFPEEPRAIAPVIHDADLARSVSQLCDAVGEGVDPTAGSDPLRRVVDQIFGRYARPNLELGGANDLPLVHAAKSFLRDRLETRVSVAALAAHVGMSANYITRVFRRRVGLGPHAWLLLERVDRARDLLRLGESPAAVAQAVGFGDQSHLNRRFKRVLGITPGEFVRGAVSRDEPRHAST